MKRFASCTIVRGAGRLRNGRPTSWAQLGRALESIDRAYEPAFRHA